MSVKIVIEADSREQVLAQMEEWLGWMKRGNATNVPAATPATEPTPIFQSTFSGETWPPGECPKHHRPFKDGKYGQFCSSKDETQPKGYCTLVPGDIWNGKRLVA